jgi:AcrR family transcriptional regulator
MDLRIRKTKNSIINSFIEIRSKKELERITVKELCEAAQINKSTFYSHYHDIYELSEELETEVVQSIIEQMNHPDYVLSHPEIFHQELYEGYMAKSARISVLFSGTRSGILANKIEKSMKNLVFTKYPEYEDDVEKNITLTYCIYGAYFAFCESKDYNDKIVMDIISKLSDKLNDSMRKER